jgi:hypothetical protein
MKNYFLIIVLFLAGCTAPPQKVDPAECYDAALCYYYSDKGKTVDCSLPAQSCSRVRTFERCVRTDMPTVFTRAGSEKMTFRECYDLLR